MVASWNKVSCLCDAKGEKTYGNNKLDTKSNYNKFELTKMNKNGYT